MPLYLICEQVAAELYHHSELPGSCEFDQEHINVIHDSAHQEIVRRTHLLSSLQTDSDRVE